MKFIWKVPGMYLCAETLQEAQAIVERHYIDDPIYCPAGGCYSIEQWVMERYDLGPDDVKGVFPSDWFGIVPLDEVIEIPLYETPIPITDEMQAVYDGAECISIGMEAKAWAAYLPVGWTYSTE